MKKVVSIFLLSFATTYVLAQATLKKWDHGSGTNNWSDAANWFPDGVPTSSDSVVLDHQYLSGNYTVDLPNTLVTVTCLSIYPNSGTDSIFVNISSSNTVAPNLKVTGIGYNALRIGNRGRFNNNANTFGSVIMFDDLFNYGLLLDVGGYFYQGSKSSDTTLLRRLTANINSTFEFDRPTGSYQNLIFPVNSLVGNVTFYNLIFSGKKSGSMGYGGTLANNWNLIINGDLTVRDNASFGVVVGSGGQIRYVRIRGNINIINTTNTLWFESAASVSFGWFTIFEGTTVQNINGNVTFLDSVIVNNPSGIIVNNNFDVKTCAVFPVTSTNPLLRLKSGLLNTVGSGIVRILLTGTNTIVNHSVNSYVNGLLRRNVTGTGIYDFPVGTATNYELATVSLSGVTGSTSLTAQFMTSPLGSIPVTLTESGNNYDQLLNAGFWRITPNVAMTGGNYTLTLNEQGYTNGGQLYYTIVKRVDDTNPWTLQGSHVSYSETASVITAQRNNFLSFSDFAIAFPNNPLPVTLLSFNAFLLDPGKVKIDWSTASEINNNYFTIEKSKDGIHWQVVAKTEGSCSSNGILNYTIFDDAPYGGVSYYRLEQTDFDGKFRYSEIRTITTKAEIKLYPNPTSKYLTITGITGGFQIINTQGIKMITYESGTMENSVIELDISNLSEGIYYFISNENRSIEKFIKVE